MNFFFFYTLPPTSLKSCIYPWFIHNSLVLFICLDSLTQEKYQSVHVVVKTRHDKTGRLGCKSNRLQVNQVILSELKRGSGQSGCRSGQVDLYFSHKFYFILFLKIFIFIFLMKTTCICHLESHATNYLMQNTLL